MKEKEELLQRAGRSALWYILGGVIQTVIRLGASVILARILSPSDYGIFGLAILARELIQLLGAMGMGAGIIAKKNVTDEDLCTCFWSLAFVRCTLFLIAYFSAPLIALFFKNPDITVVIRAVSFTFLFSIMSGVSIALLQKKLLFGRLVIINLYCVLIESVVAVALSVLTNCHYWSLVSGFLVSSFVSHLSILILAKWSPKFVFSLDSFRFFFRFGVNTLGTYLVNYLHQNIDYLIVGRFLGTQGLGFYQFAYQIPHIIRDRLAQPVGNVVFPALSIVQDNDQYVILGYIKAVKYIALCAFPILGLLATTANYVVVVLWGQKWLPIVFPMQLLCLCAAIRCIFVPVESVFLCKNRPDIPMKFGFVCLIFTCLVVTFFSYWYGNVNGVAIGMLLSTLPYIYLLRRAFKITSFSISKLLFAIVPSVMSTVFAMISAYIMIVIFSEVCFPDWVVLMGSSVVGILGYAISLLIFFHSTVSDLIVTVKMVLRGNVTAV